MTDFQYKGVVRGKSAASYLSLRKQLGIYFNLGVIPRIQDENIIMRSVHSFTHVISMTLYQVASWSFDHLFGWEFPDPISYKRWKDIMESMLGLRDDAQSGNAHDITRLCTASFSNETFSCWTSMSMVVHKYNVSRVLPTLICELKTWTPSLALALMRRGLEPRRFSTWTRLAHVSTDLWLEGLITTIKPLLQN